MSVQTKINQAIAELERLGYVGQQHIEGITALIQSDQRISVAIAVRRYTEKLPASESAQTNCTNNSTGDKLQDTLSSLSDLLGDRLLEGVVSKAVDRCHNRLVSGDWTINTDTQKKLQNLRNSLDVEFQIVEENFLSLPSSSTPNEKLLPSSEEIFDNAVIGNITQLQ